MVVRYVIPKIEVDCGISGRKGRRILYYNLRRLISGAQGIVYEPVASVGVQWKSNACKGSTYSFR